MIQLRKEKTFTSSRAEYSWTKFREYFDGKVLDVGAGGSPKYFKAQLGDLYFSADVSESRNKPDVFIDLESDKINLESNAYGTVLCFDCLEHCENIHSLFDELLRVSSRYVIVSLPNNWPTFIWSMLKGKNFTHKTGYGLPREAQAKGVRHKWWFNLEEAEGFLRHRAKVNNAEVKEVRYVFDAGDAFLRIPGIFPDLFVVKASTIKNLGQREDLKKRGLVSRVAVEISRVLPTPVVQAMVFTLKVFLFPLKILDEVLKFVFWGWGSKYRYLNLFCRQILRL